MRGMVATALVLIGCLSGAVNADTAKAQCEIYPAGSDRVQATVPCAFSQRQGYITITRDDGVVHDLSPEGDTPGNFTDQDGEVVYRQSGLGSAGQIFRFPEISLFVYWDRGASGDKNASPTAPFSTDDYDATALLPCGPSASDLNGSCPAGVMRMEDGQASVTTLDAEDQQFTMNFMKDISTKEPYVNATNRAAEALLEGDVWTVTIDGARVYQVPLAFIEGG